MVAQNLLDYILVPLGLLAMVAYHLWLLCRIVKRPATTVVGINAIKRRSWVHAMMQDSAKNGILAVQTLRNGIMESTILASVTLSWVFVELMNHFPTVTVHWDMSMVKIFAILICFLLAFLLMAQSIQYYSHASILMSVPDNGQEAERTAEYVVRGGYFSVLGFRAFYFSIPLFCWAFGSISMLVCCVVLVGFLFFLDVNWGWEVDEQKETSSKGLSSQEYSNCNPS